MPIIVTIHRFSQNNGHHVLTNMLPATPLYCCSKLNRYIVYAVEQNSAVSVTVMFRHSRVVCSSSADHTLPHSLSTFVQQRKAFSKSHLLLSSALLQLLIAHCQRMCR